MDKQSHGRHIAAIIIGSLQLIAPDLVASGFFGIVAPPYYEIKSARDTKKAMFVRDQSDIVQWNAEVLYEPYFKIDIADIYNAMQPKTLEGKEYAAFAEVVTKIGIAFDNLSEEMSINPLILEGLARCTGVLSPETMDVEHIRTTLGADRVVYERDTNTLIITIGGDEYVPLFLVPERIRDEVLPLLHMIKWHLWIAYVSTIKTEEYKDTPLTLYQIYLLFQKANTLTQVKPIKGVGSMQPNESHMTCMDPRYRKVFNITSVGDISTIMALLGTNTTARKQLKDAAVVTESQFM